MSGKFALNRVCAVLVVVGVCGVALNMGTAVGAGGVGPRGQAAPPTAATVPPERTVPRPTAARKVVKKKVVRRTATTVKKAKATTKTTAAGASSTTVAGASTTTVAKAFRATVSGSGTYVAVRAEPDPKAALLKRLPDGTVVSITCQVIGVSVADPGAGLKSPIWNKLVSGGYITNMYTSLYVDGETKPAAGRACPGTSAATSSSSSGETSTGAGSSTSTTEPDTSGKVPAKPPVTSVS